MLDIYSPKLEIFPVYVRNKSGVKLGYNHDIDIIKFKNRYFSSWNGNACVGEDMPGQYNFLSTSNDGKTWSEPYPFLADCHCLNPVASDNQWQPVLANLNDELLICAWCDFWDRKTYIATSIDGEIWQNQEVANAPAELAGQVLGFPTNHSIITSTGRIIIPCSLPPYFDDGKRFYEIEGLDYKLGATQFGVGISKYCALLMSDDNGKSWFWSKPVHGVKWSEIGEDPALHGGEDIILWEPSVYEESDGSLGLLVRNSTSQNYPKRKDDAHHMLLYGKSYDDGMTFSPVRPVEVETTYSRNLTLCGTNNELFMIHNDNPVNCPARIPMDRYNLSLFVAPVPDPDLLLPGPLVQGETGRAFYPNGFIEEDTLHCGYTTDSNSMYSAVLHNLPLFDKPFLMETQGRGGVKIDDQNITISHYQSCAALVLTKDLTLADKLMLKFSFKADLMFSLSDYFHVLTMGGVSHSGFVLCCNLAGNKPMLGVLNTKKQFIALLPFVFGQEYHVNIEVNKMLTIISINEVSVKLEQKVLRKIAFGGLYANRSHDRKLLSPSALYIRRNSIEINSNN